MLRRCNLEAAKDYGCKYTSLATVLEDMLDVYTKSEPFLNATINNIKP
jgi:hypothetical protein